MAKASSSPAPLPTTRCRWRATSSICISSRWRSAPRRSIRSARRARARVASSRPAASSPTRSPQRSRRSASSRASCRSRRHASGSGSAMPSTETVIRIAVATAGLLCASLQFGEAHSQETQPPKLRTPEGVRPVDYAVELEIKPDAATFRGWSDIEIEISRPSTVVWLNARFLSVERAVIDDVPAEVIPGGDDFVGIRPPVPVAPGRVHLHLEYRGQISDRDTLGVFRQREGSDWYAYTQFESISARRAFPCFDEPGYKVPWQLSLRIREEHIAVSNTPVASEVSLGDGMKRVTFARTPPLPSYLVAFGVGPFDVADAGRAGRNDTPLRIIVPRGMAAQAA